VRRRFPGTAAAAFALALTAGACGSPAPVATPVIPGVTTTSTPAPEPSTTDPATPAPTTTPDPEPAPAGPDADDLGRLARLTVVDTPPPGGYVRDLFPTWLDIDGDGCDAREQALRATSNPAATVGGGCKITTGTWFSDYDGVTLTAPADVDIDHVVPLAEAWRSGAAAWTTDQRAVIANDQANLWPVSAASNRSKSDSPPNEWRPPRRDSWCTYARRWVTVKGTYRLTITTPERDALGQMLDTCSGPAPTVSPAPAAPPVPPVGPAPTSPPATTAAGGEPRYANCAAARAAGAAPLHRGEPGYREALDGDHDGIACE
jgi:hypothetical protein